MKIKKLKYKQLIAFSGLGNNQNFFDGLKNLGFHLFKFIEFPDHHKYQKKKLRK